LFFCGLGLKLKKEESDVDKIDVETRRSLPSSNHYATHSLSLLPHYLKLSRTFKTTL